MDEYFRNQPRAINASASSGWECRELSVRHRTSKSKEHEDKIMGNLEGDGEILLEAKLGSAAENLMRYENLWKKNLYCAIKSLREMQYERLERKNEFLQNKAKKRPKETLNKHCF
jgi:hypothetical protein